MLDWTESVTGRTAATSATTPSATAGSTGLGSTERGAARV